MTAPTKPRSVANDPLRTVEAALLGTLFLGLVAMLSLPGASPGAGWIPTWLVAAPATALATCLALRLRRRAQAPVRTATTTLRRRRPTMAVATRRHGVPSRRATRLLAALVLR